MITEQGYIRRTYQEVLDGKIQKAKELFGEDIDTRDITPLGKYLRINAYDQADTEETAEMLYYSIFPHTATGASLDRLCPTVGIKRRAATPSRYTVKVIGEAGETVPVGFLVATETGMQFYNISDVTIGNDNTCEIVVECVVAGGDGNVSPQDITVIVNPSAEVNDIEGVACISAGTAEEDDVSLRARYDQAQAGAGACSKAAIEAALTRIEGVQSAYVFANEEDTTVGGIPPHRIASYVQGGEDKHQEIAETILAKKAFGIKTHGAESVVLDLGNGETYTVFFSHTENINTYISIKIRTNVHFGGEKSEAEIINNVVTAINSLGIGNSLILSSLYGKIYSVEGVAAVTELKRSTNGGSTYSSDDVILTAYQSVNCAGVTVEVVE